MFNAVRSEICFMESRMHVLRSREPFKVASFWAEERISEYELRISLNMRSPRYLAHMQSSTSFCRPRTSFDYVTTHTSLSGEV